MKTLPSPQSTADLEKLIPNPGGDGYIFFEDANRQVPEKTLDFRHINACLLFDIAYLSYATDAGYPTQQLGPLGFTAKAFGFERTEPPHILVAHNSDIIVVAFRGTRVQEIADILADIDAVPSFTGTGFVHSGFQKALVAGGVWDQAKSYVAGIQGNQLIFFTGHSLGAALVTLARLDYRDSKGRPSALYTFGSPRVGDVRIFCASYPGHNYRVINDQDVVTHLPSPPLYGHVGTPYGTDGNPLAGNIWQLLETQFADIGSALAVSMLGSRRDRLRQYLASQPYKPLADHAPQSYGAKIWNSLT